MKHLIVVLMILTAILQGTAVLAQDGTVAAKEVEALLGALSRQGRPALSAGQEPAAAVPGETDAAPTAREIYITVLRTAEQVAHDMNFEASLQDLRNRLTAHAAAIQREISQEGGQGDKETPPLEESGKGKNFSPQLTVPASERLIAPQKREASVAKQGIETARPFSILNWLAQCETRVRRLEQVMGLDSESAPGR